MNENLRDILAEIGMEYNVETPQPQEQTHEEIRVEIPETPIDASYQGEVPPEDANGAEAILEQAREEAISGTVDVTDEDINAVINSYGVEAPAQQEVAQPQPEPVGEANEQEENFEEVREEVREEAQAEAQEPHLPWDGFHPHPGTPASEEGLISQADAEVERMRRQLLESGQISLEDYLAAQNAPLRADSTLVLPHSSDDNGITPEMMQRHMESVYSEMGGIMMPSDPFSIVIDPAQADIFEEHSEEESNEESTPVPQREPEPEPNTPEENRIPVNSPTIVMDTTTTRFSGAEWFEAIQQTQIILAGLGGIGSWTALQLARMCPEVLVMYDDDTVESVNLAGQMFAFGDVGKTKAAAIYDLISKYSHANNVYAEAHRFTEQSEAGRIMICGFDNMSARRIFFNSWKNYVANLNPEDKHKCLFIDGRLSMDTLQVFCITGDDGYNKEKYETRYLFSDEEADPTVCSMKQTTYLAAMIGSFIVNLFTNFVANTLDPIIPYDLPFKTEYDAQNMIFKTEN